MFRVALSCLCAGWLAVHVAGQYTFPQCPTTNTINGVQFPALIDVTIEDLQFGLESGLFTSQDLVTTYMERINEVNGTLHMLTEMNPDAMSIAATLDAERAAGNVIGPLHGIPIIIKNNIATDDKMNNTAGSFSLLGAKVPRDSTMAANLRAAGAIILGKANLSQWANYRSYNTSNGWSAYGGQTMGAYLPQQDPSGSSSGSAVSSSIGLALGALGTETSGSILSPSSSNNLVGIKPTVGLTSRYLVIPISQHQDTIGPIMRTVKDAAYVLQAIAGRDSRDNYTSAIPNKGVLPDYVAACDPFALRGARIGIPENVLALYTTNTRYAPVLSAFYKMVTVLEEAGAVVVTANFTGLTEYRESGNSSIVLGADFVTDLKDYLNKLTYNPNNINNEEQLRAFTEAFPGEDFSPTSRDVGVWNASLALGFGNKSPEFWAAYQANLYLGGEATLLGAIQRNNLSAVILPTPFSPGYAAITGSPVVTVPMGFYPANQTVIMNGFGNLKAVGPNYPFGLSFMGMPFTEATLIGLAYAYEQRTNVRNQVQPYIVPNTELNEVVAARINKTETAARMARSVKMAHMLS